MFSAYTCYNIGMKTAIVTGASGGIGSQIAQELSKKNYAVIGCYRNGADVCEAMAEDINKFGVFDPYCLNLRSENETAELVKYAVKTYGRIDILVNCAGIGEIAPLTECNRWEEIIDINLNGTIRMCRAVLPHMFRQGGGNIINISSVWGECGSACEAPYSASKGGVNAFTKALAKETGIMGIRVNAVAPGFIDTEMNASLTDRDVDEIRDDIPVRRLGTPADVAKAVLFLTEADYVTGQIITVDGGWTI